MFVTETILKRFWNKVIVKYDDVGNPLLDECMEWNAGHFSDGYGAFFYNYKTTRAHRFIYYAYFGDIPDAYVICHTCDNINYVNPNHLFLGTVQDNHDDCKSKGRTLTDSKNPYSKLTEQDVVLIKQLLKQGFTCKSIGEKFNMARVSISDIKRGKSWSHITI